MTTAFSRQLNGEILKLFSRKRTYLFLGAFLFAEIISLGLLAQSESQQQIRKFMAQAGVAATDNGVSGLTLAAWVLIVTVPTLGALAVAQVSGEIVAREVERGIVRMMLCRPISRSRIVLFKYMACLVYTGLLLAFTGSTALLTGLAVGGTGGLFVHVPAEGVVAFHEMMPGLVRFLISLPLLALSLTTVASVGFFFSCCPLKPATATMITLLALSTDFLLRNAPALAAYRNAFLTTQMSAWIHVFEPSIPWSAVLQSYAFLLVVNAMLFFLSVLAFKRRDLVH